MSLNHLIIGNTTPLNVEFNNLKVLGTFNYAGIDMITNGGGAFNFPGSEVYSITSNGTGGSIGASGEIHYTVVGNETTLSGSLTLTAPTGTNEFDLKFTVPSEINIIDKIDGASGCGSSINHMWTLYKMSYSAPHIVLTFKNNALVDFTDVQPGNTTFIAMYENGN